MSCSGFFGLGFLIRLLVFSWVFFSCLWGFFGAIGGGVLASSGRLCEGSNALFFRIRLYE